MISREELLFVEFARDDSEDRRETKEREGSAEEYSLLDRGRKFEIEGYVNNNIVYIEENKRESPLD